MCQSKEEGGKRCEHAEAYNNEKKRLIRKYAEGRYTDRYNVRKELEEFLRVSPDIAYARLPKHAIFESKPASRRPVPQEIQAILDRERSSVIEGSSTEEREARILALYEENKTFFAGHENQAADFAWYAMSAYEQINSFLRSKRLYNEWAWENEKSLAYDSSIDDETPDYTESRIKPVLEEMDKAFARVPKDAPVRKTYRFFEVPAGVKPSDYIDRYIKTGEGFHEKGYMSTSADPEFIAAKLAQKNRGKVNRKFIVLEVVSNRGVSLQNHQTSKRGNIQSQEQEVLLPRDTKFRIAGVKKRQKFRLAEDRPDLLDSRSHLYAKNYCSKGDETILPVIQLVDESLI